MYKLFIFFLLITVSLANNSCLTQKEMKIERLEIFDYIDTIKDRNALLVSKGTHYLVENYCNSKKAQARLDSFVNKNRDSVLDKYSDYYMTFYNKSSKTNIANLTKNPRDLDRYSQDHDLLFMYWWSNGKFMKRYKFKNGEMVDPKSDIIVKEVTDSIR